MIILKLQFQITTQLFQLLYLINTYHNMIYQKWEELEDIQILRLQLSKLDSQLKKLRTSFEQIQNQNLELKKMQIHMPNKEELQDRQSQWGLIAKIRYLSKSVLHLSRLVIQLRERANANDFKASLSEQLKTKNNLIQELNGKVDMLEEQLASERSQRLQYYRSSIIQQQPVNYIPNDAIASSYKQKMDQMQAKIKKLEQEKIDSEYLFVNERNIIQKFKKTLEQKQRQIQAKQYELNAKKHNLQAEFGQRKTALQSQYINKIRSLKQFSVLIQDDHNLELERKQIQLDSLSNKNLENMKIVQTKAIYESIKLYLRDCILNIGPKDSEKKKKILQSKRKEFNDILDKHLTALLSQF